MKRQGIYIVIICLLSLQSAFSQIQAGDLMISGTMSYTQNNQRSTSDRSATVFQGQMVPPTQYLRSLKNTNFVFRPRINYFFNQQWSAGIGLGYSRSRTTSSLVEATADAATDFIYQNANTFDERITNSYAPQVEVGYHIPFTQKWVLSITAYTSFQWFITDQSKVDGANFVSVVDNPAWETNATNTVFKFNPSNVELLETNSKTNYWVGGIFPTLRYSFSRHFGVMGSFGGFTFVKKTKDTINPNFVSSTDVNLSLNPTNWSFGVFYNFGLQNEKPVE